MPIAGCHLFPVIGIYFINLFALLCELVQVKAQSEDADELVFGVVLLEVLIVPNHCFFSLSSRTLPVRDFSTSLSLRQQFLIVFNCFPNHLFSLVRH